MITATSADKVHVSFAGKVEHTGETTTVHVLMRQDSATQTEWRLLSAVGEPYLSIPTPSALQIGAPATFGDFDSAVAAFVQAPGVYRLGDADAELEVLSVLTSTPIAVFNAVVTVFSDGSFDPEPLVAAATEAPVSSVAGSSALEAALRWHTETRPAKAAPAARPSESATTSGSALPIPGGNSYWPRTISGTADVDVLRAMRGHMNVRIVGPPGCGKTTLPQAAFGDDLTIVPSHGDLTVASLYGQWLPAPAGSDTEFIWADGPLVVAAEAGGVFLLDDANRAPEEVISSLLSATDDRKTILITDRPDRPVVRAADGFMLIMTFNEDDYGTHPLSRAMLRRCPFQIRVNTDFDIARHIGVHQDLTTIAENCRTSALQQAAGGRPRWWPQMADLLAANTSMNLLGSATAAGVLLAACPERDTAWFTEIAEAVFGHAVTEVELGPPL